MYTGLMNKVTDLDILLSINKTSISGVCTPNMKSLSLIVQKLWLKLEKKSKVKVKVTRSLIPCYIVVYRIDC